MSTPSSISAVESKDISILFYARSDSLLATLTAQKSGEDPTFPLYTSANVILNNNVVTVAAPQISAVAYTQNGNDEIRVYYIDNDGEGGNQLKELCQTNGQPWRTGVLDENAFEVSKTSLISANVEDGQGDLKVFFQKGENKNEAWVAWVTLGQTTWSQRKVSNNWGQ